MKEQMELTVPQKSSALGPASAPNDITRLLEAAIDKGVSVETMEKLVGLHERVAANQARAEFHRAMAAFRDECPPIPRRTESDQFFVTKNGVRRPRRYATLEDIESTIREHASRNGLSWRWGDAQIEGNLIRVPCIVSHVGGHSESASVPIPFESNAGASPQQKYGISLTYGQRYSLIQAFGLTTAEEDTDADDPGGPITEGQAASLAALIEEVKMPTERLFKYLGVKSIGEIRQATYPVAVRMVEEKRRAAR